MSKSKQSGGLILIIGALAVFGFVVVNNKHDRDKYALFNAAQDGDLAKVKLLIQQGASINQQQPFASSFGWTPLIGAIVQGKTNVAHYLVETGADVNLADKGGKTPLMWTTTIGDDDAPLAKYLIAHGANLDAKDKDGFTVFDNAHAAPPRPAIIEVLEAARQEQKKTSQK